ncbi:MAG TPA: hypothetical protein ENO16_01060, partial [Chromatiales bacterium]|nr:hypothetical protein [Chromatiales bacterium]
MRGDRAVVWSRIEESRDELSRLCQKHDVRRLALFGSAAGPDFKPGRSDLDFLVEFKDLSPSDYAEAYFGLWEDLQALFSSEVDLVT